MFNKPKDLDDSSLGTKNNANEDGNRKGRKEFLMTTRAGCG
jgi:hypothetical protein